MRKSNVTNGLGGVEIQAADPDAAAALWSKILNRPVDGDIIRLDDDGEIRFVPIADDRGPGVSAYDVKTVDRETRAGAGAQAAPSASPTSRAARHRSSSAAAASISYEAAADRRQLPVALCAQGAGVSRVKGIPYEVDHLVPFFGDDRFSKLSPLRRIPVLVDGDLVLTDSSVICQYLEDFEPTPALFPADIRDRARARWLEEFADTRMGDVFIWRLFNQIAIRPSVWGEKGDRALVDKTLTEDVPAVLDYLEAEAPAEGFRFGSLGLADIAPACFFRNAGWVRFQIDADAVAAYGGLDGAYARVTALRQAGGAGGRRSCARRSPSSARNCSSLGAPISADTLAAASPRRGVMPI